MHLFLFFPPLVLFLLLEVVTSVFRYLIHEHCGLSVVLPLHLQNPSSFRLLCQISWSCSWPYHHHCPPSLRPLGQGYFPWFTVVSCPHSHTSYLFQVGFPGSWLGSPLTPLLLSNLDPPDKTWLWFMPSNCLLHVCAWVAQISWRKHTIWPTDYIFKPGPQISNELICTCYSYCIPVVGWCFLSHQVT